jgi:SAM-dependent methyltransferase
MAVRTSGEPRDAFREMELAHRYCQGQGIELGAGAQNPFGLPGALNVAPCAGEPGQPFYEEYEFYRQYQEDTCGAHALVDLVGRADSIPVPDHSQDYVISSHVIEHVANVLKAFLEWNRVLRPGGVVFMIFPHRDAEPRDGLRELTSLQHFIDDYRNAETEETDPPPVLPNASGELSPCHYHVFSLQSMLELIGWANANINLGWRILDTEENDSKVSNGSTIVARYEPATEGPGQPMPADDESGAAERKRPALRPLQVLRLASLRDTGADSIDRALNALGAEGAVRYRSLGPMAGNWAEVQDAIKWANVVLFGPDDDPRALHLAQQWGRGTVYVADGAGSDSPESPPESQSRIARTADAHDRLWIRSAETDMPHPPAGDRTMTVPRLEPSTGSERPDGLTPQHALQAVKQILLRDLSLLAIEKLRTWRQAAKPRLLVIGFDGVTTTHIGALEPCRELERQGLIDLDWREPDAVTRQDIDWADAVYVVRAFEIVERGVMDWLHHIRTPLVFAWDDDFFSLPQDMAGTPLATYYEHPRMRSNLERVLREASLVGASTPPLVARSRTFNSNVMVETCGLRPPECRSIGPGPQADRVRIGFFGSNGQMDKGFIIAALQRLRKRYGNRIDLEAILVAEPAARLSGVLDWHSGKKLPYADSMCLLRERQWDIGLAPMLDTEFNAAKQATKFRDYAWCGAAIVASNVPCYRRTIVDGVHGLLVDNKPSAWVKALSSLIENPERGKALADNARRTLEEVYLQDRTMSTWYQLVWRVMESHAQMARFGQPAHYTRVYDHVSYRIVSPHDHWTGIGIFVGTFGARLGADLRLDIAAESGQVLRSVTVPDNLIEDNWWVNFDFPPIANSENRTFVLRLSLPDRTGDSRLAVYDQDTQAQLVHRVLRKLRLVHSARGLYCRLHWLKSV